MEMEIGSRLREARESKGMSLEEVQEMTKIQKRYLQAIEGNDFKVLPGKFYTRAFIREYASAVGLNPEEIMEDHKNELPTYEDEGAVQYSRVQKSKKDATSKSSSASRIFPSIVTVLLIVGLLFVIWFFWQNGNDTDNSNATEPTQSNDDISVPESSEDQTSEEKGTEDESNSEDDGEESGNKDADEKEKKEEKSKEAPEAEVKLVQEGSGGFPEHTYDITGVKERSVTIELSGGAYLEVQAPKNGENMVSPVEYGPGDSPIKVDFNGKDQLFIKTGNAPATTVKINDQEVKFPNSELSTQKLLLNFK